MCTGKELIKVSKAVLRVFKKRGSKNRKDLHKLRSPVGKSDTKFWEGPGAVNVLGIEHAFWENEADLSNWALRQMSGFQRLD